MPSRIQEQPVPWNEQFHYEAEKEGPKAQQMIHTTVVLTSIQSKQTAGLCKI